jgi:hypothetical protein
LCFTVQDEQLCIERWDADDPDQEATRTSTFPMPATIEDTFGEMVQVGAWDSNPRDREDFFEKYHHAR